MSDRAELCPACGRATYIGVLEEPCAADSDLACALRQRDVAQVVARQATRALAEARDALGVAWLSGGVSLAEGIRRKTARLEELSETTERALTAALAAERYCACGRRQWECDGTRSSCTVAPRTTSIVITTSTKGTSDGR